jgi:hypothetical protein
MKDFREVDSMSEAAASRDWMRDCHDYKVHAYRIIFQRIVNAVRQSIAPLDDKRTPELQMADLMADVARESVTRWLAQGGVAEAEPKSIKTRVLNIQCWGKYRMLKVLSGEARGI